MCVSLSLSLCVCACPRSPPPREAVGVGVSCTHMAQLPHWDFLYTPDQLENTPSRQDGVSEEAETINRVYGCELIADANLLLQLPQVACARASVLFHRFYQRRSMMRFSVEDIAMGSLFLSAKLEEQPRSYRSFLNVFHRLEHKKLGTKDPPPLFINSDEWYDLRSRLLKAERFILREVGFVTFVEHPHKFIGVYLHALKANELAQQAWNYLNDSLRTTLCLKYQSHVIACGAIYMASRVMNHQLPEDPAWWLLFDTSFKDIEDVCLTVLQLYKMPKAHLVDVKAEGRTVGADQKPTLPESSEVAQESAPGMAATVNVPAPVAGSGVQPPQGPVGVTPSLSHEDALRREALERLRKAGYHMEGSVGHSATAGKSPANSSSEPSSRQSSGRSHSRSRSRSRSQSRSRSPGRNGYRRGSTSGSRGEASPSRKRRHREDRPAGSSRRDRDGGHRPGGERGSDRRDRHSHHHHQHRHHKDRQRSSERSRR